ncbi:cyclic nucleotide-binding domain-containing protein [Legionella micdadei]|uniref:cAMP-binding domain of CRP or a regulatory subunit of cAMP-dependent protein kinases n=1 Tax=Legionella micdadei TaxID=451 RepID=A0A098GE09_LEGMI|nr:cyclic nucleotide-binding domain-containing protein [Legionella micdadei]KTD28414.1 cNMP binding domain-containing protein [Legionella micdadei]NSL18814.1 cyclic nucleotide-binding domain-containing protein [Legionella micdadei]CEG60698.1 cAMP-binding protein [Legionella micdadei]SCX85839.1 cAMP-binding domain of CRP or a regulatory subunit of cAMP-dependent protein kinases [Legionella micdadei]
MIEKVNQDKNTDRYIQWIYDSENFTLNRFLNKDETLSLLNYSQIITYSAGEIILKQGIKSEGIFIVIEGNVNVTERILDKSKFPLGVLSQGSFLGAISYIADEPSHTSFIAGENVTCLFISKIYLSMVSLISPMIHYKIIRAITHQVCNHLKNLNQRVSEFIASSDMSKLSLYGRVVHSISKPSSVPPEESDKYKEILIKNVNYFDLEEWNTLFRQCQFLDAPKNCKIISESEKNTTCHIVIRGAIQSSIMRSNRLAKLSVIGPYTLLANLCLENTPFAITFIACEKSILLKMNEVHLKSIEVNQPLLWYKLYNLICKSVVALQRSVDKLDSRLQIENYNR